MAGRGGWLLVTAALLAACSAAAPSPSPVVLTVDCAAFETAGPNAAPVERDLAVPVGATIHVRLCSNASTGFAWDDPTWTGDPSVELSAVDSQGPASPLPGAAGQQAFAFKAVAAGTTRIEFVYSQPWPGGTKGAWRLTLTVTVS